MNFSSGIGVIVLAGLLQGTFMLPMKYTQRWNWENTWFCFSCTAYLLIPWALVILPYLISPRSCLRHLGLRLRIHSYLAWGGAWRAGVRSRCGTSWARARIRNHFGSDRLIGTLIPFLIFSRAGIFSIQGELILTGVILMLAGIGICSWAGKLKDQPVRRETKSGPCKPQDLRFWAPFLHCFGCAFSLWKSWIYVRSGDERSGAEKRCFNFRCVEPFLGVNHAARFHLNAVLCRILDPQWKHRNSG